MKNIYFSGTLDEFMALTLDATDSRSGYIYAFFFKNGIAKVGASSKPKERLDHLLQTVGRSGNSALVHRVILTPLLVDFIQQEKALHKCLPQAGRSFEYFKIGVDGYMSILADVDFKTAYTPAELEDHRRATDRAKATFDALTEPLRLGRERNEQMEEFSFGPKAGAVLTLLARAIQTSDHGELIAKLELAEQLLDSMPESVQKEDAAAIYCAVSFAISNGVQERFRELIQLQ